MTITNKTAEQIKATTNSAFRNAYVMFRDYIGYVEPLSYMEWNHLPSDYKAAALFVQFYEAVTNAWLRLRTPAAIEEECLEEALQYIIKNVAVIEANPARFTARYIYKVTYNAIYCKSVDPYSGQTKENSWYNNTTSCYVENGDHEETCLFDFIEFEDDDICDTIRKELFWKIVSDVANRFGDEGRFIINELCGGTAIRGDFRKRMRVSEEIRKEVLAELSAELRWFVTKSVIGGDK